jgi:hypothetical protein
MIIESGERKDWDKKVLGFFQHRITVRQPTKLPVMTSSVMAEIRTHKLSNRSGKSCRLSQLVQCKLEKYGLQIYVKSQ